MGTIISIVCSVLALVISILFAEENPIINKIRIKLKTYSLKKEIKLFYLDNKKDYYSSWNDDDVILNMGKDTLFYINKFYNKYTPQEDILNIAESNSKLDFLSMLSDSDFEYCYKNDNKFRKRLNSFRNSADLNFDRSIAVDELIDALKHKNCSFNYILYKGYSHGSFQLYTTIYLELCIACSLFKGNTLLNIIFNIFKNINSKIEKEDLFNLIKYSYDNPSDVSELFYKLYVMVHIEKNSETLFDIIRNISCEYLGDGCSPDRLESISNSITYKEDNQWDSSKEYRDLIFIIKISLLIHNQNYNKLKSFERDYFIIYEYTHTFENIKFNAILNIFETYLDNNSDKINKYNSLSIIKDFIYN